MKETLGSLCKACLWKTLARLGCPEVQQEKDRRELYVVRIIKAFIPGLERV